MREEEDDDIMTISNRQRRIALALSDIIEDHKKFDKSTRKAAKKTDPRHVEAFMRLEQHDRNIEALDEAAYMAEVVAAIAAIPPTYAAIAKLADDLRID